MNDASETDADPWGERLQCREAPRPRARIRCQREPVSVGATARYLPRCAAALQAPTSMGLLWRISAPSVKVLDLAPQSSPRDGRIRSPRTGDGRWDAVVHAARTGARDARRPVPARRHDLHRRLEAEAIRLDVAGGELAPLGGGCELGSSTKGLRKHSIAAPPRPPKRSRGKTRDPSGDPDHRCLRFKLERHERRAAKPAKSSYEIPSLRNSSRM